MGLYHTFPRDYKKRDLIAYTLHSTIDLTTFEIDVNIPKSDLGAR